MNIKNGLAYLLNPRSKLNRSHVAQLDGEEIDWARPQLLSNGVSIVNLPLISGLVVVLGLVLVILFGPLWASHDPHITAQAYIPHYDAELRDLIKPPFSPSLTYPLGTDIWGNDLLSMILHGARVTLIAGAYVTAVRVIVGVMLGSLAGWFADSLFDRFVMGLISAVSSIPMLLSSMILIFILDIQNGLWVFIVALAFVGWTEVAQYIRSEMLVIRGMPYIEGAQAVGLTNLQTIVRHALPNVLAQALIIAFLEMGAVLILLAELGFLGLYIGGGTNFTADIYDSSSTTMLNEVPEWGALVSLGAPYLRSYPYMVLAPASAFFIAVAGLNMLGEGLRQAVERSAVSTNFLLQKRMLVVVAAFILVTALVLRYTGPALSYNGVAGAFDGETAYQHMAALNAMDGRGAGQAGGAEAAAYIEEQFKEIGLQPGWKVGINSSYDYRTTERLVRPLIPPQLALVAPDGTIQRTFQHQTEFGYVIDGHGGSGQAEAPLLFVGFQPGGMAATAEAIAPDLFDGLNIRGKIVMLVAGNVPDSFVTEALRRGAQGILWVTAVSTPVHSQTQLADPEKSYLRNPTLPIFKLHEETANRLLESAGVTVRQLITNNVDAAQNGPGWFAYDLDAHVAMSLQLDAPQETEVVHVMGFFPGYDNELAGEVIVIFSAYDGLGADSDGVAFPAANQSASGTAVMLEMARLFLAKQLDPRRSVIFIAWGGSQLDESRATAFLDNNDNFRKLAARVNTPPPKPVLVFHVGSGGTGGADADILWVDSGSDELMTLWRETAVSTRINWENSPNNQPPITQTLPALTLQWANSATPHEQDTLASPDPDKLQQVGETLSLTLIKILRQTRY